MTDIGYRYIGYSASRREVYVHFPQHVDLDDGVCALEGIGGDIYPCLVNYGNHSVHVHAGDEDDARVACFNMIRRIEDGMEEV